MGRNQEEDLNGSANFKSTIEIFLQKEKDFNGGLGDP